MAGKGFVLDDTKMPRFEYVEKLPVKGKSKPKQETKKKPKKTAK